MHRIPPRARQRSTRMLLGGMTVALLALAPGTAKAQQGRAANGFLLGTPGAHFGITAGYAFAFANSDLFEELTDRLTLTRGDFSGPAATAELGVRLSERLDFTLAAGYAQSSARSEFRRFVDNNDQPIEQTTTFQRVPVTGNLKLYLTPRGRAIGRLAWIPTRVVPWVGLGAGTEWYRLKQVGDFINSQNNNVFASTLITTSWAPAFKGMGGIDLNITPRLFGVVDARYIWAKGDVGGSFSGYDKIDLSGITASVGLSVRL